MKTIEINLYEFNELSEQAQERAIADARGWVKEGQDDIVDDEYFEMIEPFERCFGIEVQEWADESIRWMWADESRWTMFINFEGEWLCPGDEPKYFCRFLNEIDDNMDSLKEGLADCFGDTKTALGILNEMMANKWEYVRMGWSAFDFVDLFLKELRKKRNEEYERVTSDEAIRELLSYTMRGWDYYTKDGMRMES